LVQAPAQGSVSVQASETVLGWVQVQASEPELVPASAQAKASELETELGLVTALA